MICFINPVLVEISREKMPNAKQMPNLVYGSRPVFKSANACQKFTDVVAA
jgi:hypothetical protein